MIMTFRRWLTLFTVLIISAIFLSIHGWRLLKKSEWLQKLVQQQLVSKFGDALHYQRLEASLAGVHLSQVTYVPPARSFQVSVEKISVTFRLWDLLKSVIKRQSSNNRGVSNGGLPADSLIAPSAYHLDILIERPSLTLIGDWHSRLRKWQHARSTAGKIDLHKQLATFAHSFTVSSRLFDGRAADSSATEYPTEAPNTNWSFELVRRLDISDGAILWDPLDGRPPMILANEIAGNLDPSAWAATALKTRSEAQLSGKLLSADNYNFFVRALVDLKKGWVDSIKVALYEVPLQQLEKLWKFWESGSPSYDQTIVDSLPRPLTARRLFDEELEITGGTFSARLLLLPQSLSAPPTQALGLDARSMANFHVSGALQVRNGQMHFGERMPITIQALHCDAQISGDTLRLHSRQRVNQQPVRLSGMIHFEPRRKPKLDLTVDSDSLMTAEFLLPFLRTSPNDSLAAGSPFPIRGRAAFRGWIRGALAAPKLEAKIHAPDLFVYNQHVQNLAAHLQYAPPLNAGAGDSTMQLIECTGELDGLHWKGWGELNLRHPLRQLRMNLLANGELTPAFLNLLAKENALSFNPPRYNANIEAQIVGPLKAPKTTGEFTLYLPKGESAKPSKTNAIGFWGNFAWHQDTLQVETCMGPWAESAPPCENRKDNPQMIEMRGEIFGLALGKAVSPQKPPLLKMHGRGIQLLPGVLGKALPARLASQVDFDTYFEGSPDSLNIRVAGRHKTGGYTLFQSFSYLRSYKKEQRLLSGEFKLFPGGNNEIAASYSAIWQDSVFYVTDLRAGDWLAGALEIQTAGSRAINGSIKITRAQLSRLVENVAREAPRYDGQLFGEIHLSGTLDAPYADGDFWLREALFNGAGKFSASGKARIDGRGWEISKLDIRKNGRPFLQGEVSYQRATSEPRFELRANDVDMSEFLSAVAGVPTDIMAGRMSFALKTSHAQRGPEGDMRLPLEGFVKITTGRLVWFAFDEIEMKAAPLTYASNSAAQPENYSYLSANGVFFNQARYEKTGAFALQGTAYLPFNLQKPVDLALAGDGNFLAVLPDISTFFQQTSSSGHLDLNLTGPYNNLTLRNSYLRFKDGFLKMSRIAPSAHDIAGEAFVDERGKFINVFKLAGKIGDADLQLHNQESPPPSFNAAPGETMPLYQPLRLGNSPLHFGTILLKSSDNGVLANVPGLMERGEVGRFVIAGQGDREEFLITGPWAHPQFNGRLVLEGVDFMFPFDEKAEPADSLITKILYNIDWDVVIESRKDNRYVQKTPTAIDNVYVNLGIDDDLSKLRFTGILQDSTFRTEGALISTRGAVEYLDLNFRVEKFGAEFDKSDWRPIVYGRAWTTQTDSTNFPYNVYLTLHTIDPVTREEVERGRFQNAYFKLSSNRPGNIVDNTQEQILASLGYSIDNVRAKATEAVGISTDNLVFRPLIRPVERQLERHLGLDVVRLSSRFTRNFLLASFNNGTAGRLAPATTNEAQKENAALAMLQSTRLFIGKYLWSDLYFNYIGQIEIGPEQDLEANLHARQFIGLGLRHTLGLEYRINPAMHLQFEYDYNPFLLNNKDDRKIWLRHSFPVEFGGKEQE